MLIATISEESDQVAVELVGSEVCPRYCVFTRGCTGLNRSSYFTLQVNPSLLSVVFLPTPCSLLTRRSAIAAHVISRHPLHLSQDCLGQLLHDVVLANVLVPFKGLVQSLLLTVL